MPAPEERARECNETREDEDDEEEDEEEDEEKEEEDDVAVGGDVDAVAALCCDPG